MIDTHAHIDADVFDIDRSEVIKRAFDDGMEAVIVPGIEPARFESVLKTAESHKNIFFGIGVHPHNAHEYTQEVENKILKLATHPKAVAIGEIGLDYYYDFCPQDTQRKVFSRQLELAVELGKPVIVHNRDSDADLMDIIYSYRSEKLSGVLHCFSGDEEMLAKALDAGFYVSFTGNITFKKSILGEIVKSAPIERIMIETDSPYMTPVPLRGKRNEPKLVRLVAEKIAEIKSMTIDEVLKMTTNNAKQLFKLSMIMFVLMFASYNSYAQRDNSEDEYEDEEEVYEQPKNLYPKQFGIGPIFGTNTVVETYTPGGEDVAYEGVLAYGAMAHYQVLDYLGIEAAYINSVKQPDKKFKDLLDPTTYQQIQLTTHWIPNPYGRINFYGTLGLSMFFNKYSFNETGELKTTKKDNSLGMNAGVGMFVNVNLNSAGILVFMAEWRLDFMFKKTKLDFDPRKAIGSEEYKNNVEVSTFFSIPRVGVIWYPKI